MVTTEEKKRYRREYMRMYYQRPDAKQKTKERTKRYYQENKEVITAKQKEYCLAHKEKIKEYQRQYRIIYRKKYPERVKGWNTRYQLTKKRKLYLKEYYNRPEVIERRRKQQQTYKYKIRHNDQITRFRYSKNNTCFDCGRHILNASTYCVRCSQVGERSYNWQGGLNEIPYTSIFKRKLRKLIRAFYNYTCVGCWKDEDELGHRLSIHHIDYNRSNNHLSNLLPLCQHCHGITSYNRQHWKAYYPYLVAKFDFFDAPPKNSIYIEQTSKLGSSQNGE